MLFRRRSIIGARARDDASYCRALARTRSPAPPQSAHQPARISLCIIYRCSYAVAAYAHLKLSLSSASLTRHESNACRPAAYRLSAAGLPRKVLTVSASTQVSVTFSRFEAGKRLLKLSLLA